MLGNIIDVYVENNLYEKAVKILEGKEWNTYIYTSLIKGLSQKNLMKEIIILYRKMKESNNSY
jgi:pentatricopeptide repeat protein